METSWQGGVLEEEHPLIECVWERVGVRDDVGKDCVGVCVGVLQELIQKGVWVCGAHGDFTDCILLAVTGL